MQRTKRLVGLTLLTILVLSLLFSGCGTAADSSGALPAPAVAEQGQTPLAEGRTPYAQQNQKAKPAEETASTADAQKDSPAVQSETAQSVSQETGNAAAIPQAQPSPKPQASPEPQASQTAPASSESSPAPVSQGTEEGVYSCTFSISCETVLDNLSRCPAEKRVLLPSDGWVFPPAQVSFRDGESVFDVLLRTCQQNRIHLEFENTPVYGSAYIEGIANLYEFDVGELSGWMYQVNDWFPNYGCSQYLLRDGDTVCWVYTCDLGGDIGGSNTMGD